jgi:hypothetical protein
MNFQGKCLHTSQERLLTGMWTTAELQKAVENGYVIQYIYEIWHWDKWSSDIFKKYVETFFRMKICASGFPNWCESEDEKKKYVKDLNEKHGLGIGVDEIIFNPGLRTVAKNLCNQLWGKMAEGLEHEIVQYTSKPSDLTRLMSNKMDKISDIFIVNDTMVRIQYKSDLENRTPKIFQNIPIASHVTSYGRLHLYGLLRLANDGIIYADTDSAIFELNKESDILQNFNIGTGLGEITSELQP